MLNNGLSLACSFNGKGFLNFHVFILHGEENFRIMFLSGDSFKDFVFNCISVAAVKNFKGYGWVFHLFSFRTGVDDFWFWFFKDFTKLYSEN